MPESDLEGFDIGGNDDAVDEAFAAAFAQADSPDTGGEEEEPTPGDEPAGDAPPRDDLGRFAPHKSLDTDPDEEPEEEPEEPAAAEPDVDPIVAEYLSKYGNDPNAALKAAAHQNELLGRQGSELGELRQQLEQLRTRVDQPAPVAPTMPTADQVEQLDQLAIENPMRALVTAVQMDPSLQLRDRVMDIWFATNPRQAAEFQARVAVDNAMKGVEERIQPSLEAQQQAASDAAFQEVWNSVAATGVDLDSRADSMVQVLNERPALGNALMSAEDPEVKAQLLRTVYDLAQPAVPAEEVTAAAQAAIAQQSREEKIRATVTKPRSSGSVPGAGGGDEPTEDDRIRSGILNAETTDIMSGWSQG